MATAIPLGRHHFALVDDADADWVRQWRWSAWKDTSGRVYARRYETKPGGGRRLIALHRALLNPAPHEVVDHRDGDPSNNQRANLRIATTAQNIQNRRRNKNSASGFKGVRKQANGSTYYATIMAFGQKHYLGNYPTAEQAFAAYCEASARLHGEFGRVA